MCQKFSFSILSEIKIDYKLISETNLALIEEDWEHFDEIFLKE